MSLSRRSFLGWSLGIGAGLTAARLFGRAAHAADAPYTGPLLVTVHAGGGWDPIFLTDPKPSAELNRVSQAVGTVGRIRFSDHPVSAAAFGYDANYAAIYDERLLSNRTFFTRHGARTTVFNGVDTRTNNHDTGTRYTWSGRSEVGNPAIGALLAAMAGGISDGQAKGPPLAFLSAGGYDNPGGLVPLSRASSSSSMRKLMFPGAIDASKPDEAQFHSPTTTDAIARARAARLEAQTGAATLPAMRRALGELAAARGSMGELSALELPTLVDLPGNNLEDVQAVMQTTQLAMASMKAGLTLAASLSYGGFDTHGNHDRDQVVRIAKLLGIVDHVLSEAAAQGLSDRLYVAVGSDFGRGPFYNGTNANSGKDHWSTTSCLVIVPPARAAQYGDRVIGGTTDDVRARAIAPGSFAFDDQGVVPSPLAIHRGLRKLLGISGSAGAARFPLAEHALEVF